MYKGQADDTAIATDSRRRAGALLPLLSAMLFVTGACGLIYQQLWLREMSLVFGVTVYAAATVLAAFMAGLALGSLIAGRLVDRARRPLVWFGICEALVGVAALVTPTAMRGLEDVYVAVSGGTDTSLAVLTVLRLVLGFTLLLLPATLMGASMPIAIRASVSHGDELGSRTAWLYSMNTAGAIVGTVLAGFFLIGEFGLWRTFVVAAIANFAVGVSAVLLDRVVARQGTSSDAKGGAVPVAEPDRDHWVPDISRRGRVAVLWVFAVSGFVTLALEIVWFRVLVLYVESNTYAFSAMLATVLAGIAIGSALITPFLRRRADWYTTLIVIEALLAVIALSAFAVLARSYDVADVVPRVRSVFSGLTSLMLVFPSALLMGIAFPIGVLLWGSTDEDAADAGKRVGIFYACNLVGAIFGSLVAGFVLVPTIGTRGSLLVLAVLLLGSVAVLVLAEPARARVVVAGAAAVAFVVVSIGFVPDPYAAPMANRFPGSVLEWKREGVQTTVSIQTGPDGSRQMFLDGLTQANDSRGAVHTHRLIGTLPALLQERPRRVLVVGLGGGVTAGAAATTGDVDVDVVELSDEVVDAAEFFDTVNEDVTDLANVDIRIDDGRNFLLLTDERYDVITADIIQPKHAGAGKVWSKEYWELTRDALADDGIVVQWIGAYRPEAEYKMIARTFLDVFPDATVWDDGNLLVGTKGPLRLNQAELAARLARPENGVAAKRARITDVESLLGLYTAGPKDLRRYVGEGPRLTDDRPRIEYFRSLPSSPLVDIDDFRGEVDSVLR